jgi:hypothetical protein
MATSGTTAFNLEISEVIEEAFERCGLQSKTGYDIETARRSLNLLSLEWVNRGLNFWTVEQGTKTLTASTSTVTMDYPEAFVRSPELKAEYEFQWHLAEQEDRDRASVHFVPGGYS